MEQSVGLRAALRSCERVVGFELLRLEHRQTAPEAQRAIDMIADQSRALLLMLPTETAFSRRLRCCHQASSSSRSVRLNPCAAVAPTAIQVAIQRGSRTKSPTIRSAPTQSRQLRPGRGSRLLHSWCVSNKTPRRPRSNRSTGRMFIQLCDCDGSVTAIGLQSYPSFKAGKSRALSSPCRVAMTAGVLSATIQTHPWTFEPRRQLLSVLETPWEQLGFRCTSRDTVRCGDFSPAWKSDAR
jgi:hypothetical protein